VIFCRTLSLVKDGNWVFLFDEGGVADAIVLMDVKEITKTMV
jgi:hypothetical protein